ncbi:MAG: hypothetical protein O2931_08625 [Planctomycetota bacterium]|nr:hypothetical protein [Planctomycetota bacterium]
MMIRPAVERDAPAIARVHVASWRVAYRLVVPNDVLDGLDVDRRATQWAANITDSSSHTLVAEWHGDIVGFTSFSSTRDEDDDPKRIAEIQSI